MHQRLMVAVLIDAGELDVAVDVEAKVALLPSGQRELLVGRLLAEDHGILEHATIERALIVAAAKEQRHQPHQRQSRADKQRHALADLMAKGDEPHQGHHDVDQADHDRAVEQAQQGQKQQRERQRAEQSADVVPAQHVRQREAQLRVAPDVARQQRDLQADQRADGQRDEPHHRLKVRGEREHAEQQGAACAAQHAHAKLNPEELL